MESQLWHISAWLFGRGSQKRNNGLHRHFCLGEIFSLSPYAKARHLKLSPYALQEGIHLSKSVHSPFTRNCLLQKSFISLSQNSCLFLQPEVMGDLSGTGTLGWGAWCEPGTPCSSEGTSTSEIPLPIFICHTWVWSQPFLHFCP